jgi:uncharacterized repeat protein (TIGR04138 family)
MSDSTTPTNPTPQRQPLDLESAIRKFVISDDPRYELGAYLFIYEAIAYTQRALGRDNPNMAPPQRHVSGQELLGGIRDYATELFGPLAPVVFRRWGIERAQDFGDIVFNLVEHDLLGKTEDDSREDFAEGFDFSVFDGPVKVEPQ